jgi:hypothetical protein
MVDVTEEFEEEKKLIARSYRRATSLDQFASITGPSELLQARTHRPARSSKKGNSKAWCFHFYSQKRMITQRE